MAYCALTGRSLGSDQCMIHRTMYDTSIHVYSSLSADLDSILLLLAYILLVVIVAVKLDLLLWQLTALASYQVSYI